MRGLALHIVDIVVALMLAMNAYILGSRVIDELNHRAHGDFLLIRSFSELAVSAAIVAYFMWRFRSWRTGRQQQ